ncbi:MAG: TadG family pilus assembly protein [Bdellovibrionota bacterium]
MSDQNRFSRNLDRLHGSVQRSRRPHSADHSLVNSERGVSAILLAVTATAIVAVAALAIDLGEGFRQKRLLSIATDAGALYGAQALYYLHTSNPTPTQANRIVADAANFTTENAPGTAPTVELGVWNAGTFTPASAGVNAVRVKNQKVMPTVFTGIWGINSILPNTESVAAMGPAGGADCLIPWGLAKSFLQGRNFGDTLTIPQQSNGNWGKLDINGNMSSGPNYLDAMEHGLCGYPLEVGDTVSPGTGNAQLQNAFDGRLASNPIVTIPIVNAFGNGNANVTIVGFAVVQLIAQRGNGGGWSGDFKLLDLPAGNGISSTPIGSPYASTWALVK